MQSFKRKSMSYGKLEKKSRPTVEQALDSYVNNPRLSDVCFLVNDKKIYAHRLLLALSNAEFERLFFSSVEEQFEMIPSERLEQSDEILVLDCSYCGLLNLIR